MKIIIDEYSLESYSDAFLVSDDKTFIEARKLILKFKRDEISNKSIVVNTYPYSIWFYDLENENRISVESVLPSFILQKKFESVEIDKDIEETDIVFLDLINDTIEPTEISIVNKYIGSFLQNNKSINESLYQITNFAANPPKKFLDSKYLIKKWTKYLDKFQPNTKLINALISKIKERDTDFCKVINKLVYMSNSETLLREFMHDEATYLELTLNCPARDFEKFLRESKFPLLHNEEYEIKIEKFFKTLFQEDISEFFKEKGEYKATLKAFLTRAKSLTNEEKDFIFSKYGSKIDYEIEEKIKSLIKPELIPPPQIDNLSLSMQIDAWHKWAIKTYIPFKFYLDEFPNLIDINLVEKYAIMYSDWLFNSYFEIIQNGLKTNFNITSRIHNELSDYNVIWLIIDGFPSVFTETLNSILKSNGINKIEENYYFAALPTITEIGIPTQLNGLFPNAIEYTSNKEEALKRAFNSQTVIFKNSIKHFADALESDFNLCCLHWHEIDEFMHKDDNQIDIRRIEEIKRLLNIRINQISNFLKSKTNKKTKLIISSDHGSTKCLTKGLNIKNSSLLEACKDNPKQRCVELNSTISKAKLDENEIYYLKNEVTHNLKDWVIAKGYRYFGSFDYGYRHGGLTPEETIVPFLVCEIAQNEIIPIKVLIGGLADLQLGYTETIKLQVKNDNDAIVEIHKIQISEDINFNIDINKKIQPLSSKIFEGDIKIPKSITIKDRKAQLNVFVDYSIFGERRYCTSIIEVPIKKSLNENLDNLFN